MSKLHLQSLLQWMVRLLWKHKSVSVQLWTSWISTCRLTKKALVSSSLHLKCVHLPLCLWSFEHAHWCLLLLLLLLHWCFLIVKTLFHLRVSLWFFIARSKFWKVWLRFIFALSFVYYHLLIHRQYPILPLLLEFLFWMLMRIHFSRRV